MPRACAAHLLNVTALLLSACASENTTEDALPVPGSPQAMGGGGPLGAAGAPGTPGAGGTEASAGAPGVAGGSGGAMPEPPTTPPANPAGEGGTGGEAAMGGAGAGGETAAGGTGAGGEAPLPGDTDLTPLLGGESEEDRAKYHFKEEGGTVVIEAEHFVRQVYGNEDYRAKRWWMVQRDDFDAKSHASFKTRCDEGVEELKALDTEIGGKTIRSIITNHSDVLYWTAADIEGVRKENKPLTKSGEQVVAEGGCDPDESHASAASGGAYVELLPDMLFNNNNAIPHAGCNWTQPEQAPRAYYKVTFTGSGNYKMCIRAYRTGSDSGSAHGGFVQNIGQGEDKFSRLDLNGGQSGNWTWTSNTTNVSAGEGWIVLAGREDGFEVDKIVLTQGNCPNGMGPVESATVQ